MKYVSDCFDYYKTGKGLKCLGLKQLLMTLQYVVEKFLKPETKDWPAKKVTIFNTSGYLVKLKKTFCFFACILPDFVADEITKEF